MVQRESRRRRIAISGPREDSDHELSLVEEDTLNVDTVQVPDYTDTEDLFKAYLLSSEQAHMSTSMGLIQSSSLIQPKVRTHMTAEERYRLNIYVSYHI